MIKEKRKKEKGKICIIPWKNIKNFLISCHISELGNLFPVIKSKSRLRSVKKYTLAK